MAKVKKTQFKGILMLFLTALIWGTAFVAQSVGMESLEGFTFNGIRMLLGASVLAPIIIIKEVKLRKKLSPSELIEHKKSDKRTVIHGVILGFILCMASNLQQFSFNYSPAGKVAFVSAFYMLFVPILGLFFRKRVPWVNWMCVCLGVIGLYFLCVANSGLSGIGKGEMLAFGCAIVYAVHILLVERFVENSDGLKMACIQFAVCGVISAILMGIFEKPTSEGMRTALIPLLYSGLLSCGIAYTFQILGQKYTESTVASLLLCMESVFGVIAGAIILHERLNPYEITGCVIMFTAIIIAQFSNTIESKVKHARLKRSRSEIVVNSIDEVTKITK